MRKGFTLIELIIVMSIVVVLVIIGINLSPQSGDIQYGINGVTTTRCIGGYKCVIGPRGHVTQLIGQDGKPIVCSE
jgi:prepilin-type N-terminal cleavage/methylation domain-containing protein